MIRTRWRALQRRRTNMVKAKMARRKLDITVMRLSWNRQAKPTTRPVNTTAVFFTSRQ